MLFVLYFGVHRLDICVAKCLWFNIDQIVLLMQGEEEKKHGFVFPKKEELIDEIKLMDDEIENVSLNLVKCDFNAVEKDVEKTFPDFQFIKIKKYNPGSFEVIFQTRIDAIHFIRNSFDKKICNRRFFIKMGRQQRQHAENWAAVGYVPKAFKQQPRKHNPRKQKQEGEAHEGEEHKDEKREHRGHHEHHEHKHQHHHKKEYHQKEHKAQTVEVKEVKSEEKPESKPVEAPKPEIKEVKNEPTKPVEHKVIPKIEHKNKKDNRKNDKKPDSKQAVQPKEQAPKAQKAKQAPKKEQPKEEETKPEDDGWIVVPPKKGKGKK